MPITTINPTQGVEQWLSKTVIPESPFTVFVKNVHPVSNEAQAFINQKAYPSQLNKGEVLISAGTVCKNVYLIRKGILRSYIKEEKKEITTWISGEQELAT